MLDIKILKKRRDAWSLINFLKLFKLSFFWSYLLEGPIGQNNVEFYLNLYYL